MNSVLIISGHPDLDHSVANREILAQLEKALPQVEIVRLDLLYPNYQIDVAAEQYQPDGAMHHTVEQFLPAFQQLAKLCQMQWLPPVYSNGMMTIPNVSTAEQLAAVREKALDHATRLVKTIQD